MHGWPISLGYWISSLNVVSCKNRVKTGVCIDTDPICIDTGVSVSIQVQSVSIQRICIDTDWFVSIQNPKISYRKFRIHVTVHMYRYRSICIDTDCKIWLLNFKISNFLFFRFRVGFSCSNMFWKAYNT